MTAHDLAQQQGSRVGLASRYRSLFVLGRGGMGFVEAALAIDRSAAPDGDGNHAYSRVVALKRLLPDATRDARHNEMFLREARLATMLDHPNVVRAYDYGEIDGELYLSMEYVEGQPLSRVLRAVADTKGALGHEIVAWLLSEASRGLHAAHELVDPHTGAPLNLVHRDVSPQNVMIGYDGRVRLLDFGVAKIETETLTKTGEVKGKTAYMSPEQAMGDPLDRRSDLFGLGAVLYECLTLRRMWGDGTDMDVLRKLALESPPELESDLPEALVTLYARLVARSRSDRPATALDVANALAAFVVDPDAVAASLRSLLERHFGRSATEERARLGAALDSVAPAHAEHLRQSLAPTHTSESSPSLPPAPVTEPERPHPPGKKRWPFALVALAVAAVPTFARLAADRDVASPAPTPSVSAAAAIPPPSISQEPTPSRASSAAESPAATMAARPTVPPSPPPSAKPRKAGATPSATMTSRAVPPQKLPELDEKPF